MLSCEINQRSLDFLVLFLSFPFLEERFECGLEIECHCSETGAFEVEVEVHVVLLLRIGHLGISHSHGLSLDINRDLWLLFSRLLLSLDSFLLSRFFALLSNFQLEVFLLLF